MCQIYFVKKLHFSLKIKYQSRSFDSTNLTKKNNIYSNYDLDLKVKIWIFVRFEYTFKLIKSFVYIVQYYFKTDILYHCIGLWNSIDLEELTV